MFSFRALRVLCVLSVIGSLALLGGVTTAQKKSRTKDAARHAGQRHPADPRGQAVRQADRAVDRAADLHCHPRGVRGGFGHQALRRPRLAGGNGRRRAPRVVRLERVTTVRTRLARGAAIAVPRTRCRDDGVPVARAHRTGPSCRAQTTARNDTAGQPASSRSGSTFAAVRSCSRISISRPTSV